MVGSLAGLWAGKGVGVVDLGTRSLKDGLRPNRGSPRAHESNDSSRIVGLLGSWDRLCGQTKV